MQNGSKQVWEGASTWSCSEYVHPGEPAPPSGSYLYRLCTSAYSALSILCQPIHHPTLFIALPHYKPLLIYIKGSPRWIGAWVKKNKVIGVFWVQCLPTKPKISTTITRNTHNLSLQAKILHHLQNRQIQVNTTSSSVGGNFLIDGALLQSSIYK